MQLTLHLVCNIWQKPYSWIADFFSLVLQFITYNGDVNFESCTLTGRFIPVSTLSVGDDLRNSSAVRGKVEHKLGKVTQRLNFHTLEPLDNALAKLRVFSKSMGQRAKGKMAERIIAQLMAILDHAQYAGHNHPVSSVFGRQIQYLKGKLEQTTRVTINEAHKRGRTTQISNIHSDFVRVILRDFEICLMIKTVASHAASGSSAVQKYSALHVNSLDAYSGSHVTAFFKEQTNYEYMAGLHPTIMVYNQVASRAEVFRLVENDDLDGLKLQLQIGKVSLRDCDRQGRTLLFVSLTRPMCYTS